MATPNMNLTLPTVSQTLGPLWATQSNAAFTAIDSHNHSTGQGVAVPSAGLNINADLPFGAFNATQMRTVRFSDVLAPLTNPSDAGCVYVAGGNLYYNSGTGAAVQITAGAGLAGTPGSISGLTSPAALTYTSANTKFTFTSNTNIAAQIDNGPVTIRQMTSGANGITIQSPNSLAAAYSITLLPALPAGQRFLTIDNVGTMSTWNIDGTTIAIVSGATQAVGVTQNAANTSATIKGNRSAADAGADVVLTGQVTRTAGWLCAIQNNGTTRFNFDFPGDFGLTTSAVNSLIYQQTANGGITLRGNKNAADTGSDIAVNSAVTRTAGSLFDIQNNGTSLFTFQTAGTSGNLRMGGVGPVIFTGTANDTMIIQGGRNAADAGIDVALRSAVARTAGTLVDIQNNGGSRFSVDFTGNTVQTGNITVFAQVAANNANGSLTLKGNRNAADTGSDVVLTTTVTRTAGNLVDIQNNGTSKASFDLNGNLLLKSAAGTPTISVPAASTSIQIQGNRAAADVGVDVIVNSTAVRTAGSLLSVTNSGVAKAGVDFNGTVLSPNTPQNSTRITADVTNSTTTMTNAGISFAVQSNADYFAEFFLVAAGDNVSATCQAQLTGPASPTLVQMGGQYISGTSSVGFGAAAFSTAFQLTGTSGTKVVTVLRLYLRNGINSGTVALQFAASVGTAGSVVIGAGSFVRFQRMDNAGMP